MTVDHIPLVDLAAQHAEIADDLMPELNRVLATASFVGGPDVAAFEAEYSEYCGVRHCVGLANGTDAVELALRAVGVGPGDEVVIPANTFIATAEAVVRTGGRPVLADVDPDTLLLSPEQAARAVTSRTKAIVPVHLYGQIADMGSLAEVAADAGVAIVEDGAQSQGATQQGRRSGSFGALAATSFYPGKNLGAAGDAGAVTTNDPELATAVRLLGNHGSRVKYLHEGIGFNSRLDTLQAVVLRHKLRRLETWNARRRVLAARYSELLADRGEVVLPVTRAGNEHVWHLYVIQVERRTQVLQHLHEAGIGAGIHYPDPVHLTPAFRYLGHGPGDFPVSEHAAALILSLPLYPHLRDDQQDRVVQELTRAVVGSPVRI